MPNAAHNERWTGRLPPWAAHYGRRSERQIHEAAALTSIEFMELTSPTQLFHFTRHRRSAVTNMSRETMRIVLALLGCRPRPRACDGSLLSSTVPEALRRRP